MLFRSAAEPVRFLIPPGKESGKATGEQDQKCEDAQTHREAPETEAVPVIGVRPCADAV